MSIFTAINPDFPASQSGDRTFDTVLRRGNAAISDKKKKRFNKSMLWIILAF